MSELPLVLPASDDQTTYLHPVEDDGQDSSLYITLAKRIFRHGGKQVINLAAQTAVPLRDDEPHSISDMALSLADGTRVAVSVQLLNNVQTWRAERERTFYNPQRYEAAERAQGKGSRSIFMFMCCIMAGSLLGWSYWMRDGVFSHVVPGVVTKIKTEAHRNAAAKRPVAVKVPAVPNRSVLGNIGTVPSPPLLERLRQPQRRSAHSFLPKLVTGHKPAIPIAAAHLLPAFPPAVSAPKSSSRRSGNFFIPPPPPYMPSTWQDISPSLLPSSHENLPVTRTLTPKQTAVAKENMQSSNSSSDSKDSTSSKVASAAKANTVPSKPPALSKTNDASNQSSKASAASIVEELLPSILPYAAESSSSGSKSGTSGSDGNRSDGPQLRLEPIKAPGE